jgi:Ca2+-binding RTX toxin-like protein
MANIGETTALIPQAGSSTAPDRLIDGQSGDTNFPYGTFKSLATVGEVDPTTGEALTGYPDGQAAYLLDQDTVRVVYQSESYGPFSSETYGWVMDSGAVFTGSHVHTIDYNRAGFADFLSNDQPASSIFEGSGKLFSTVYNVFGEIVDGKNTDPKDLSAKWGNQTLANGTIVEFDSDQRLTEGDFYFHSFCGAYYEAANQYGDGIGFADDVWLMGEEWNIGELFDEAAAAAGITADTARLTPGDDFSLNTMGLASMVVDVANEIAYTVPALGQSGYEKILPLNSGSEDYIVLVMAGYNLEVEPAPLKIYIGKKGVDVDGNPLAADANDRDAFLGRNGLLYGQMYGMALDNATFTNLGITTVDADEFTMDAYAVDADAPANFNARYYPTDYRWEGFDKPVPASATEMFRWEQDGDTRSDGSVEPNEQPGGYTFFNGDSKTEHPAVDPDPTKTRYIQNLTVPSAQLGIEFINIANELVSNDADGDGLPDYLSAAVTRTLAGVDGALTLETNGKGLGHPSSDLNPDGTKTHATHLEVGEARMHQPDGLQWIKAADGDFLIVDEDSGNDAGERKYILPIDAETLQLEEDATGYFLASAGGSDNPRALAKAAAIPGSFSRATSAEFSGTWNVTPLVEKKADGSFYTQAELAGAGAQAIIGSLPLAEQTFIGVVQQSGESGGLVATNKADQGGQIFQFNVSEYLLPDTSVTPILGGDSADSFAIGTNITNLLITKAGNDSVNVSSGQGGNRIFTNLGDDDIITGSGDRVYAGQGNDTITATASTGGGRFAGENGDDDFLLGSGDRVLGGNGNDKFFVGAGGGNTITGGQGTDQFWIANGQVPTAANTITDFSAGEDVLGIQGLGVTDVSQLTLSGSTIRFNSRDLATLTGVTVSTLTNANFAFA